MGAEDGHLPLMSGALPDNDPETIVQHNIDHVYSERGSEVSPPLDSGENEDENDRSMSVADSSHQNTQDSSGMAINLENQVKKALDLKPKSTTRPRKKMVTIKSSKKRRIPKHRPSLDDVLRYAMNGSVFEKPETLIPLPDSQNSSTIWSEVSVQQHGPKTSLDIILERGVLPRGREADLPASIPLPESPPGSLWDLGHASERPPSLPPSQPNVFEWQTLETPVPKLPIYDYEAILRRAGEIFEHLKNGRIQASTRHSKLFDSLSYVDLPLTMQRLDQGLVEGNVEAPGVFRALMGMIPETVNQRLIIVEDLSPEIIQLLGAQFGVSPEFFEEHLINSGYEGASYSDLPASTWTTARMRKSHISVRWHRPVLRRPEAPFSKKDLRDLLNPQVGRLEYARHQSKSINVSQTETNIIRSEWELWTDPSTTTRKPRLCGWEERVSIWVHTTATGCQIVILLLDPLPTLMEGVERTVLDYVPVERSESEPATTLQGVQNLSDDVEAAIKERHNIATKEQDLYQLPATRLQRIMQSVTRTQKEKMQTGSDDQSFELEEKKVMEKTRSFSIIEQIAPRSRTDINFEEALQKKHLMKVLTSQLYGTKSTKAEYCERLSKVRDFSGFVLLQPLFEMIEHDVSNLLELLQKSLDQIYLDILDDEKMEKSLSLWRVLITRAQFELPDLQRSLSSFISFMPNIRNGEKAPSILSSVRGASVGPPNQEMNTLFKDLMDQIDQMLQKLESASSNITQNMALLDSRRSIAEAEGIAKITELAFFFIPLTFAATLFGMEIEQLQTPAPLSLFIAVGIAFVSISYIVRLMMRNLWLRGVGHASTTWFRRLQSASTLSIELYADQRNTTIQEGVVSPTLFLGWAAYRMRAALSASWYWTINLGNLFPTIWKVMGFVAYVFLFTGIIVTAPIAILWTRPIAREVQVLLTILVLLVVIPIVVIICWNSASSERTRRLVFVWRKVATGLQIIKSILKPQLVLMIVLLVSLVVLIVVIWTQPINSNIRVAVTVTICFIGVGAIVMFLFNWLVKVARSSDSEITSESGSQRSSSSHTSLADD